MRMLLDISIPHEPFNSLVRKGVVGKNSKSRGVIYVRLAEVAGFDVIRARVIRQLRIRTKRQFAEPQV